MADNLKNIFEQLKAAAGPRGFTFLGRAVTEDDSFEDVLKRIPQAELETAGGTIKAMGAVDAYGKLITPTLGTLGGIASQTAYKAAALGGYAASQVAKPVDKAPDAEADNVEPSETPLSAALRRAFENELQALAGFISSRQAPPERRRVFMPWQAPLRVSGHRDPY